MSSERYRALAVAGGATAVLGSVLPWVATGSLELNVSSVFALVAGAAAVTVTIARWERSTQFLVAALGATAFALALEAITDFLGDGPPGGVPAPAPDPGIGAYVTLLGGLAVVAGVALERFA